MCIFRSELVLLIATAFFGCVELVGNHRDSSSSVKVKDAAAHSCPPAFVSRGNSCVCAEWPRSVVICDQRSLNATILVGYCMTYDETNGEVAVGRCPQADHRSDYHKLYYPLPQNVSDLNEYICGPFNSEGINCGYCIDGYAVAPLTYDQKFQCVKCNDSNLRLGVVKYLAIQFLPSTIAFLLIAIFGVSAVTAPLNAFIIFSQFSLPLITIENFIAGQGNIPYSINFRMAVMGLYNIWNLNFFWYFIPNFCLSRNLNGLHALALDYIRAIYPMFLITIFYICIKLHANNFRPIVWCWKPWHRHFVFFRRSFDPRTSVINAFATFMLLSYIRLITTTQFLLTFSKLFNEKGQKLQKVLYYGGSAEYMSNKHIPLAAIAIIVSATFTAIPPLLLFLYPCSLFQNFLTRCNINSHALRTFIEIFQGCFKDGTNGTRDFRYFSGLYFVLRIALLLMFALSIKTYILICSIAYTIISLVIAFLQPYKRQFYSVVDAVIFALTGVIYTIILFQTVHILVIGHSYTFLIVLTDLLTVAPLAYLFLLVIGLLIKKLLYLQRIRPLILKCTCCYTAVKDQKPAVPDRMLNPARYL